MSAADRPEIVMTHDYPPVTGGGLAIGVRELAGLLCARHNVQVLSSRLADHAADDRQRALSDSAGVRYSRATVLRAAHAIHRADVVIAHFTFSFRRLAILSLVLGPLLRKPTVCVIHTAPDHCDYNWLGQIPAWARHAVFALTRRALQECAAVVALGPAHSAAIIAVGFSVTHIAPLPVSPTAQYRDAFLHHAVTTNPMRIIGFAGELSPLKGADALPALLRALTPQYEFRIAGAGPFADALACCVAELSPTQRGRVVLAGPIAPSRMAGFYHDVDYLVVLSRTEASSRVTLEAMLAGVIVLASSTCGSIDLISDGTTGILIRPGDPASVGATLAALAADLGRAQAIRERAARFAAQLAVDSRSRWRGLLSQVLQP